jgi:hypothetical protein
MDFCSSKYGGDAMAQNHEAWLIEESSLSSVVHIFMVVGSCIIMILKE